MHNEHHKRYGRYKQMSRMFLKIVYDEVTSMPHLCRLNLVLTSFKTGQVHSLIDYVVALRCRG